MHTVAVIAFEGISPFHLSVPCIVFGDDLAMLGVPRYRLLICGEDARRLGIADGARVRVRSRVGELVVPAAIDDDLMPGVVSLPHGYGHGAPGARLSVAARHQPGANANALTDDLPYDPISGTCVANGIPVEVSPV